MNSFERLLNEDRRLVILRVLTEDPGYRANAYVLRPALEAMGHTVAMDKLEGDLAWLAELGLLTIGRSSGITVATLTARGLDVAAGRATVPGVKRPEPEA
ncbi:hypothetical protein SAMN04488503_2491 [Humidesulfovibrio mexicanus]|uniref:ArsR family transcriptional regulator n=1 Tax=Humidesulfovibrio mexicanus TaxID=147047 RepID=A0A239BFF8_9BACT|nr:hypothetical protein [Humidesulfovibrio mexicanus]SNS05824.1 hypothetical protein SAMN04488503_2491 [Humidesulfovibrio mexicanus]